MQTLKDIAGAAAFVLALSIQPAEAATLNLNLASKHHFGGDYEELNPGIGFEFGVSDHVFWSVGGYRNSYGDATAYLGIGAETGRWHYVSVGAEAWLLAGYDDFQPPVGAAVFASFGTDALNLKVLHIPVREKPVEPGAYEIGPGITGFQLRFGF